MLLRFEHRARSSADIDMIFRRDLALLESTLAEAPRYPIGDFTVRAVGKPHLLGPTGAVRQPLQVLYGRSPWSRIYLEASPPEGASAEMERLEILPPSPDLTVFGLDSIEPSILAIVGPTGDRCRAHVEFRTRAEPADVYRQLPWLQQRAAAPHG